MTSESGAHADLFSPQHKNQQVLSMLWLVGVHVSVICKFVSYQHYDTPVEDSSIVTVTTG